MSLVLATRNGERFLPASLETLRAQTYPRIEIIAVDDGSTDGTGAILEAFAASRPGTRVMRTGGIGLAGALAQAFASAVGELYARQDDDDLSHPQRIERQVKHLLANPEVALLGTAAEIIDEGDRSLGPYALPFEPGAIRRMLGRKSPFVHGTIMLRREAYRSAGGYRPVFTTIEDYDLFLRLPETATLANLPETLYRWRIHPGNSPAQSRADRMFFNSVARAFRDERLLTGRDSIDLLVQAPEPEAFLRAYPYRGRLLSYLGEAYARVGRLGEARRYLARAVSQPGARLRSLAWSVVSPGVALAWHARQQLAASPDPAPEPPR